GGNQDVLLLGSIRGQICMDRAGSRDVGASDGTGAVTVNVLATCGHGLNLHGNGPGTVFVGNNGNLDGIQGLEMSISNRSSSDTGDRKSVVYGKGAETAARHTGKSENDNGPRTS